MYFEFVAKTFMTMRVTPRDAPLKRRAEIPKIRRTQDVSQMLRHVGVPILLGILLSHSGSVYACRFINQPAASTAEIKPLFPTCFEPPDQSPALAPDLIVKTPDWIVPVSPLPARPPPQ